MDKKTALDHLQEQLRLELESRIEMDHREEDEGGPAVEPLHPSEQMLLEGFPTGVADLAVVAARCGWDVESFIGSLDERAWNADGSLGPMCLLSALLAACEWAT